MSSLKPTAKERFRYRFDNFMSKGGKSIFISLFLVFFVSLTIVVGLRILAYQFAPGLDEREQDIFGQAYISWLQMTDPGNMAQDVNSNLLYKTTAVIGGTAGVIILSMLIGLITTSLDQKLQALRKGHSQVVEVGHTLILGWSEQRIIEILNELILANESESNPAVVILADKPKEDMDDFLALMLPNTGNTRVVTRSGSPSALPNLNLAALSHCRSVIVLATTAEDSMDEAKNISDACVVKTIMAVANARPEEDGLEVVAELYDVTRQEIIQESCPFQISSVNSSEVLAKIMVQTSRSVGLSVVYSEILSFDGCEMYFAEDPKWEGKMFGELAYHFPDGVPMGIRDPAGTLALNPPRDRVMTARDQILIVADDDSTIKYKPKPVAAPRDLTIIDQKLEPQVEHELFIGWNRKGPIMIREYADYVVEGSSIAVMVKNPDDDTRQEIAQLNEELSSIQIDLVDADPLDLDRLTEVQPPYRNNIILLSNVTEHSSAEEVDARTIMILLLLRRLIGQSDSPRQPQLITEVMDSNNQSLVSNAGVRDFIISDRLVSMLLAQMSEEADIKHVYDDLFSEEGSEIYLKPLSLYLGEQAAELSFADCIHIAQQRNEICIGIKLKAFETDEAANYGIELIPDKKKNFHFKGDDCLVVLAEDER